MKTKVVVAGIGTIDECECCKDKFVKNGACCWIIDTWTSIDLCYDCLNNKYDEQDKNII